MRIAVQGKDRFWVCSCGNQEALSGESVTLKETVAKPKEVEVVDGDVNNLPITDDEPCPKCENKTAYYWLQQMRAGDEAETKFLQCTKCKHTWRENT